MSSLESGDIVRCPDSPDRVWQAKLERYGWVASLREIELKREQASEKEIECERERASERGRTGESVRV